MANVGALLPHVQAGRVRPLAVTSQTPLQQLPGVPTLAEAGVPGFELSSWIGCFLPRNTPSTVVHELNGELAKVLRSSEVAVTLRNQAHEPWFLEPDEFARRLRADYDQYGRIVKLTGARAD